MIDVPEKLAGETPARRAERRRRLLSLDRCLDVLESAMERDRSVVGAAEAAVVSPAAPLILEGTPLPVAIEVVFLLQEAYMQPLTRPASLRGAAAHLRPWAAP